MEWKKEKINPSEFERRQREYITEAIGMMKRSSTGRETEIRAELDLPAASAKAEVIIREPDTPPPEQSGTAEPAIKPQSDGAGNIAQTRSDAEPAIKPQSDGAGNTAQTRSDTEPAIKPQSDVAGNTAQTRSEQSRTANIGAGNTPDMRNRQKRGNKADRGNRNRSSAGNEKYGVFTADEIANTGQKDEGLRKAAEILDEMSRNTRLIKKLSSQSADGSDSDITDFPDFSACAEDGFREGELPADSGSDRLPEYSSRNE